MKENDYPAFPSDTETWGPIGGMTLRDYFAAKAMQAIISNADTVAQMCSAVEGLEPTDVVPIAAYGMADGMLRVRAEVSES